MVAKKRANKHMAHIWLYADEFDSSTWETMCDIMGICPGTYRACVKFDQRLVVAEDEEEAEGTDDDDDDDDDDSPIV